jgi:hypothetical protein
LARREFKNRDEVLRWYGEHQATLPDYADTAPPARTRGKVIGAQ